MPNNITDDYFNPYQETSVSLAQNEIVILKKCVSDSIKWLTGKGPKKYEHQIDSANLILAYMPTDDDMEKNKTWPLAIRMTTQDKTRAFYFLLFQSLRYGDAYFKYIKSDEASAQANKKEKIRNPALKREKDTARLSKTKKAVDLATKMAQLSVLSERFK